MKRFIGLYLWVRFINIENDEKDRREIGEAEASLQFDVINWM